MHMPMALSKSVTKFYIQSLWLMLSNNVLIAEEVENQTNKAKGISREFTEGQKLRQRSETRFCPA